MNNNAILVVSSDSALQDFLQYNLGINGYQVLGIEEDSDQLDLLLDAGIPDLVIVDISMPSMGGIKVSLDIRRKFDVPIIMLTSQMLGEGMVKGLDISRKDNLTDSIDAVNLMQWIKETFTRNAVTGGTALK